ncbi:hypothetical protein HDU77_003981 [Chytriomyces hyalinus]|nr:hypothetical protein HDU77_003981 [Chytriomyces hyalinus]
MDRIPDEIVSLILQFAVPPESLTANTCEQQMMQMDFPASQISEEEVRFEPLRWRIECRFGDAGVPLPSICEVVFAGVNKRWRRLAMTLRRGWSAFDPCVLFYGKDRFTKGRQFQPLFELLCNDKLRLASLRHISRRIFNPGFALPANDYTLDMDILLSKIHPSQLVSVDTHGYHGTGADGRKVISWLIGSYTAADFSTWTRLTMIRISWPDPTTIPSIALLLACAPNLAHVWFVANPNEILRAVIRNGGMSRSVTVLGFRKGFNEEYEVVDLKLVARAAPHVQTLIFKEGVSGRFDDLSDGDRFDDAISDADGDIANDARSDSAESVEKKTAEFFKELQELTLWSLEDDAKTKQGVDSVAALLTSMPVSMRNQLKTLRVILPTDMDGSETASRFNGEFAVQILQVLNDCSSLTALELQVGRIKLGHLALVLRLAGSHLEVLRVGRMFDPAWDSLMPDVQMEEHVASEVIRSWQLVDEFYASTKPSVDLDRTCPNFALTRISANPNTTNEIGNGGGYLNLQQDPLFWPTSQEIDGGPLERLDSTERFKWWKKRARRVLSFYAPRLRWVQMWGNVDSETWMPVYSMNEII